MTTGTQVHENVLRMREGYAAFQRGDVATLSTLFTPEVVWHVPGRNRLSGDKRGQQEVFGYFGQLMERSGGTFRLELLDVLADEEHAAGLQVDTAAFEGRTLNCRIVVQFRLQDGRVAEAWECYHDQYAVDAFFQ